jgi:hypothetical protein
VDSTSDVPRLIWGMLHGTTLPLIDSMHLGEDGGSQYVNGKRNKGGDKEVVYMEL